MDALKKSIDKKNFKSNAELKSYLNSLVGKPLPEPLAPKDARSYAEDIIDDAYNADSHEERAKLAHEALKADPDCVDAYIILAESEARTREAQKVYYEKALSAGERALGPEFFKKNKGYFWGMIESRPYMRARAGLTQCLWDMGHFEEAVVCCRKTLELNTNDNMGMRYVLGGFLVSLGRFKEVETLLSQHEDDSAASWEYTRVLLKLKDGRLEEAAGLLTAAIQSNRYISDYLTGRKPIYRHTGGRITLGGEDEAVSYAEDYICGWKIVPGAVEWLKEHVYGAAAGKIGRNDSCPCGSGKKYKKCCGGN